MHPQDLTADTVGIRTVYLLGGLLLLAAAAVVALGARPSRDGPDANGP